MGTKNSLKINFILLTKLDYWSIFVLCASFFFGLTLWTFWKQSINSIKSYLRTNNGWWNSKCNACLLFCRIQNGPLNFFLLKHNLRIKTACILNRRTLKTPLSTPCAKLKVTFCYSCDWKLYYQSQYIGQFKSSPIALRDDCHKMILAFTVWPRGVVLWSMTSTK